MAAPLAPRPPEPAFQSPTRGSHSDGPGRARRDPGRLDRPMGVPPSPSDRVACSFHFRAPRSGSRQRQGISISVPNERVADAIPDL